MKKFNLLFLFIVSLFVLSACSQSQNYIDSNKFINILDLNNDLSSVKDDEYLVYYYAVSCAHCADFKPTVKKYLEKDNALTMYAYNLDVKELHPSALAVAERFGINVEGTPTLAYIQNGKLVDVLVGGQKLDDIFVKGSYKNYTENKTDSNSEPKKDDITESNSLN